MNQTLKTPCFTPLPEDAQPWLADAAERLGIPADQAHRFFRDGVLNLPGLTLRLCVWQPEPVPQWVALALLPRPADCSAEQWSELLLRTNCAVSAMSSASLALDEHGDALLVQHLLSRPQTQNARLADELSVLLAQAECLVAATTTVQENALGSLAPAPAEPRHSNAARQSAKAAMGLNWHRPLLLYALHRLGIDASPASQIQTVAVIQVNGRAFEVIADADGEHLLVSTRIEKPLNNLARREQALRANLQLLLLTRCAVTLAPQGTALQARWRSRSLDGAAFADWLLDFGLLADSVCPSSPTAAIA